MVSTAVLTPSLLRYELAGMKLGFPSYYNSTGSNALSYKKVRAVRIQSIAHFHSNGNSRSNPYSLVKYMGNQKVSLINQGTNKNYIDRL